MKSNSYVTDTQKAQYKEEVIRYFLRILDTLYDGWEFVLCGYQSQSVFKEMLEFARKHLRGKGIDVFDVDLSLLPQFHEFIDLLREKAETGEGYRVFNIIGFEHHVEPDKVSRYLNRLNFFRNGFAESFPYGFFFWLPENLLARFALDAPDFYDWRNTTLVFEDKGEGPGG